MRRKLFLLLLIVVSILLTTEVVVRITYKKTFDRYQPYAIDYQPDSLVGFTFIPNTSFYVGKTKVHVNSKGFLGNDFSDKKKKGTFRIIFVGSCSVSGTVHLNFYANFCTTLQKLFNNNGWKVEVINCGLDGDSRRYEDFQLIRKVMKYDPDLIVSENEIPFYSLHWTREKYRGNLIEYPMGNYKERRKAKQKIDELFLFKNRLLFKLYDASYTVRAIENYFWHRGYFTPLTEKLFLHYCRRYTDLDARPQYWTVDKSFEMLKELYNELKIKKIKLLNYEYFYNSYLSDFYKLNNLPYISLFKKDEVTKSMFYFTDSHFSKAGYKMIGTRFYNILSKGGYIPLKYKVNSK